MVWCRPGVRFKEGSGGFGVWCKAQGRPGEEGSAGQVYGVVWCRPAVRFKEGSGGLVGLVQGRFRTFWGAGVRFERLRGGLAQAR